MDVLEELEDEDNIRSLKEHALRSHLQVILRQIGIDDYQSYSWHSFRRGGAYHCGQKGTPDNIIKAHGRWKSSAYIRYVSVDMNLAGQEIAKKLSTYINYFKNYYQFFHSNLKKTLHYIFFKANQRIFILLISIFYLSIR